MIHKDFKPDGSLFIWKWKQESESASLAKYVYVFKNFECVLRATIFKDAHGQHVEQTYLYITIMYKWVKRRYNKKDT